MEFLLAVAPILGICTIILLALLVTFLATKIFKAESHVKLPYGKLIDCVLLFALIGSGVKIATSPLTRPTVNEPLNDMAAYKVDQYAEIEMPILQDKTRKTDEVDVTTFEHDSKIKEHAESKR